MRRLIVPLAFVIAVLGACASPTEPTHSVTGVWTGIAGPSHVTLSLVMHPDRSVSGVGIDSIGDRVARFPVRGNVSGSTVLLLFTPASVDSGFSGRFADASRIQGSLDYPDFSGELELRRASQESLKR
jgi:hypothetical protein